MRGSYRHGNQYKCGLLAKPMMVLVACVFGSRQRVGLVILSRVGFTRQSDRVSVSMLDKGQW